LAKRLKDKAEQERIETEKLFADELETLRSSLQASSKNALATMESVIAKDITAATTNLTQHFRLLSLAYGRSWIRTGLLGLALMLGITFGGWSLAAWMDYRLSSYRTDLAQLKQDCQERQRTLAALKSETWNLELLEDKDGRFIVLPPGVKPNPQFWNIGMKKAIKLEQ
jgi:hypothetical protein